MQRLNAWELAIMAANCCNPSPEVAPLHPKKSALIPLVALLYTWCLRPRSLREKPFGLNNIFWKFRHRVDHDLIVLRHGSGVGAGVAIKNQSVADKSVVQINVIKMRVRRSHEVEHGVAALAFVLKYRWVPLGNPGHVLAIMVSGPLASAI